MTPNGSRTGQVFGYVRVSTDKQDEQRQVKEILDYCKSKGLGAPVIVQEVASGAKDRPELEALLKRIGKGDMLVVSEFSRLTRRGVPELLAIARGVIEQGATLLELTSGMQYDSSAMGELLLAFTATVDRMERERIGERTRSALRERRARGVKLGRPKGKSKLDDKKADILKYASLGINKTAIAKLIGCSRSALLNWVKTHEAEIKEAKVK